MPKHAYPTGDAACDHTYHGHPDSDDESAHDYTTDPSRRTGYTADGAARRNAPAHRANGFWTYDRTGTHTFYAAYDQT